MTNVTDGPWDWETPAPREQDREARHAGILDDAIGKVEADPDDIRALKDVCFFACRSQFKTIRERAIEAIRVAGDRHAE